MKKETNLDNVCPGCGNHCPADDLQCGKGMRIFGGDPRGEDKAHGAGAASGNRPGRVPDSADMTAEEKTISLLRGCGHHLHHNVGHGQPKDNAALLAFLSREEKEQLAALLEKCLQNWQAQ